MIEPEEVADKTGYSRIHTTHCGPEGIYVNALGNPDGDGPGGIFLMDHETFDVRGRWEIERGPQQLAYDFWWHLGYDTMITSEWGTPKTFEDGLIPEVLLGGKYGRRLRFWDLHTRRHLQEIDLGEEQQLVFELRPAHDPTKAHGFVGVVISLKVLSSSIRSPRCRRSIPRVCLLERLCVVQCALTKRQDKRSPRRCPTTGSGHVQKFGTRVCGSQAEAEVPFLFLQPFP